ncbi:MAG TPA: zf-HC2 domain-containing protein [Gemmatimonadaceae bacterium]
MSECTNGALRDLLPELVNGRLDAEMRQRVEAHVAACGECADELALLRSLRPALMREPVIDAQRIAAAVRAQTAGGGSRAPARAGNAARWKVAIAAAALLAAGALGYAAKVHRGSGTPDVAIAQPASAPIAVPPASAPLHATEHQVAVAPPRIATRAASAPTALASAGVPENVSDLSDEQVRALTASLDDLSAIPDAEPSAGIDPLGASIDDASAGGR